MTLQGSEEAEPVVDSNPDLPGSSRLGPSDRASSRILDAEPEAEFDRKTLPPRYRGGYGSYDDSWTYPA